MTVMRDAILNGFEDERYPGNELFGPRVLGNDAQEKIWFTLREELSSCQSFTWAVAFITQDMLVCFHMKTHEFARLGHRDRLRPGLHRRARQHARLRRATPHGQQRRLRTRQR